MELTWLGTAGFILRSNEGSIAFDPFLSRGVSSPSPFTADSFQNVQAIFVGHGHFDHTFDIPKISQHSDLSIFAPSLTRQILKLRGVDRQRLKYAGSEEVLLSSFKVRAFRSQHITFDFKLVLDTARRCGLKSCAQMAWLGLGYPKGLVQTYYFVSQGKKFLFISSAGCSEKELGIYRQLEVDFLLAPLQGHTNIQEIVAHQTLIINPKVVVPHHHDDFYAPLSQDISVDDFQDRLTEKGYKGKVLRIPLFGCAQL